MYVSVQDTSFVVPAHHVTAALAALKAAPVDHLDLAGGFKMAQLPGPGVPITDERAEFDALPDHVRAAATIHRLTGKGRMAGHEWDTAEWPVFAVLDADRLDQAGTLVEALAAWGWTAVAQPDGAVEVDTYAPGSLYGDTDAALAVLAPYVEPGSYVHLRDDDGEHWRWTVTDDHRLTEQPGRVVFDDPPPAGAGAATVTGTTGCGCCEINDYAAPDGDPNGLCEACRHAPEEHGR